MQPEYAVTQTLDQAFDYFNQRLFAGRLPACVITLQRKANSYGYFAPEAFRNRTHSDGHAHEIALNPDGFIGRTDAEILSTLVHEMVHLWQQVYGDPGRGRYHNAEWASAMLAVGLKPFNVKNPAKMTGQGCSHTIVAGGAFESAASTFLANSCALHWESASDGHDEKKTKSSKVKFTCTTCGANAWGKPSLFIYCGDCDAVMMAEEQYAEDD